MLLLVTTGHPDMVRYAHPNLGRLVQPRHYSSIERTALSGIPWAADNDAFGNFDPEAFDRMLRKLRGLPGCRFVAAPDVVGDADRTAELFTAWRPQMRGHPVALVAQDGITPRAVPWRRIDAVFIGGTDAFKLGLGGERIAEAARERGKWLHVGRVNGQRRIRYCATLGANSVDGSSWARWKGTWLRDGLAGVSAGAQMILGSGQPSSALDCGGMASAQQLRRAAMQYERARTARDEQIREAHAQGQSMRSIAADVGLSFQRVQQIISSAKLDSDRQVR